MGKFILTIWGRLYSVCSSRRNGLLNLAVRVVKSCYKRTPIKLWEVWWCVSLLVIRSKEPFNSENCSLNLMLALKRSSYTLPTCGDLISRALRCDDLIFQTPCLCLGIWRLKQEDSPSGAKNHFRPERRFVCPDCCIQLQHSFICERVIYLRSISFQGLLHYMATPHAVTYDFNISSGPKKQLEA